MPIQEPKRNISDAENKLRLLLCVKALGAVTEEQLWPFVASLELMEYLPMRLLLHELLSGGEVAYGAYALSACLSVTQAGRNTLALFGHRVMQSDRARIQAAAPPYITELRQSRQVRAVYEMARADDYRVLMTLAEGEVPTLTLRLATTNREMAQRALRGFEAHAAEVLAYAYGLAAASGPDDLSLEDKGSPGLTLIAHSRTEYSVQASLTGDDQQKWEITLLLPNREAARAWMHALSGEGAMKQAAQTLETLLCHD